MSKDFEVTQIAEGMWVLSEGTVHCYLIVGDTQALLIDCCKTTSRAFAETVRELTDKPIILAFTHTDPDHTGNQGSFDAPLLHPSEASYYYHRGNKGENLVMLWEGQLLELGGVTLEVVLVPGHTPGSIALLDRANKRLFIGDTISDRWVYLYGVGRNVHAFIESLKKLEAMSDSFDILHPCHGSHEIGVEWVSKTRIAAEKLLAGELEGVKPPKEIPCKAYIHDGVQLFYQEG